MVDIIKYLHLFHKRKNCLSGSKPKDKCDVIKTYNLLLAFIHMWMISLAHLPLLIKTSVSRVCGATMWSPWDPGHCGRRPLSKCSCLTFMQSVLLFLPWHPLSHHGVAGQIYTINDRMGMETKWGCSDSRHGSVHSANICSKMRRYAMFQPM